MSRTGTGNAGNGTLTTTPRGPWRRVFVISGIVLGVVLIVFALLTSCINWSPLQSMVIGSSLPQPSADACEDGEDGERGPAGVAGPAGPKGEPGSPGTGGLAGEGGESGLDGAPGATGPTGPQGEPGVPGAAGPEGPAGAIGPVGPEGPVGPAGAGCESDPGTPVVVTGIVIGSACSWVHGSGATLTGTIQWHASGNHGVLHCVQG